MEAAPGLIAANRRQGRRWRFAGATFDEASWTLRVDGVRTTLESKPLEVLHELLLRAGELVTKDELFDAVWRDVVVVDASLPTAVAKLRRALAPAERDGPIIETVRRIGYRLAVPVELLGPGEPEEDIAPGADPPLPVTFRRRHRAFAALGLAVIIGAGAWFVFKPSPLSAYVELSDQMRDASDAIRRMDIPRIETLLREGWDPNTAFDDQRNGAMTMAINICEWNPHHDRQRLLLLVRTLMDGGARIDTRNVWGDTPYSIAAAPRYCGPDHPVSRMIYTVCTTGVHPTDGSCWADYANAERR